MSIIVNIVVFIFGLLSGLVMVSLCQSVSKMEEEEEHRFDGKIFYLCDQDFGCGWPECHHTSDIMHAKNFEYENGYFWEKEKKDEDM